MCYSTCACRVWRHAPHALLAACMNVPHDTAVRYAHLCECSAGPGRCLFSATLNGVVIVDRYTYVKYAYVKGSITRFQSFGALTRSSRNMLQ